MGKRTIVLLSAPRCGSTAIFKVFQKHPDAYALFEPNFWNFAAKAIGGDSSDFEIKCNKKYPFIELPPAITEEVVFNTWNRVLEKCGPVVFDKSPLYLGDRKALTLIKKYRELGNDFRMFALIRDPRDTIVSQHELWRSVFKKMTIDRREARWLNRYQHLEEIQEEFGYIPVFRYEDVSQAPRCYIPMILQYCGLQNIPQVYDHIRPTSIGRHTKSINLEVRRWKMSFSLKKFLVKYGYKYKKESLISRLFGFIGMLPGNIYRGLWSTLRKRKRLKQRKLLQKFQKK